jgi:hypothetical protein
MNCKKRLQREPQGKTKAGSKARFPEASSTDGMPPG